MHVVPVVRINACSSKMSCCHCWNALLLLKSKPILPQNESFLPCHILAYSCTGVQGQKANDLSCGTLYAAAVTQTSAAAGGSFDINFIDLGFACEAPLIALANTITFTDMFDTAVYNAAANSCPSGFSLINTGSGPFYPLI